MFHDSHFLYEITRNDMKVWHDHIRLRHRLIPLLAQGSIHILASIAPWKNRGNLAKMERRATLFIFSNVLCPPICWVFLTWPFGMQSSCGKQRMADDSRRATIIFKRSSGNLTTNTGRTAEPCEPSYLKEKLWTCPLAVGMSVMCRPKRRRLV